LPVDSSKGGCRFEADSVLQQDVETGKDRLLVTEEARGQSPALTENV